jgi:hypothetical protein
MKPIIQLRTIIPSLFTALAVLCLVAAPKAFGVSPPPDGGYPGGNTAEGQKALFSRTTGGFNTAVGWFSLDSLTTGSYNTGVGAGTLVLNSGDENTATGVGALLSNTTGMANTATGAFALFSNTIGSSNSAFGAGALFSNTTGDFNTAIGDEALFSNTSGSANIAIGLLAGNQLTTGDHNIDIDNYGVAGESGIIRIGATGVHTTTYIAGIAGQTVGAGGSFCYVDNEGKLGVFLSARRFKTDIADMAAASEGLLALRPVTFHYKPELDKTGIPQFGLVAEEVAKVNPDLVTHDAKGELSTVRYEAVNAMLLNEFLKEHRKVEEQDCRIREQETTIAALKKQMETVVAHAKEQDSQIQKVSAQIEMNKPAPQVVVTNH